MSGSHKVRHQEGLPGNLDCLGVGKEPHKTCIHLSGPEIGSTPTTLPGKGLQKGLPSSLLEPLSQEPPLLYELSDSLVLATLWVILGNGLPSYR